MRHRSKRWGLVAAASMMVLWACERPEVVDDPEPAQPEVEEPEEVAIAQEVGDIGDVDFETSCNEEAQQNFEVGLGLLHHMWYARAEDAFDEVVDADPECAMGYWGIAMTQYTPLWYPPEDDAVETGQQAVEQARDLEADEREEAFIEAIGAFFDDYDGDQFSEHEAAFYDGWQQAHERDEDDIEAKSFYALAILATAPVITEEYEEQRRAGQMMEEVLEEQPRHPAGHHYLIHAYDFPPLAEDAEEVARDYADIAPAVPHALHMPAHIFVRLGEWDDVIEWDTRAAEVAEEQQVNGQTAMDFYHSLDYVVYAYLQQGLDDDAEETAEWFAGVEEPQEILAVAYPAVAIPARIAVEQRDWEQAAELEPLHADDIPLERWPVVELVKYTVQTTGAAFSDDVEAAQQHFERVDELNDEVAEENDPHWAPHAQAYRDFAQAIVDFGEGHTDVAVEKLEEVADFQDSFDKHPTMPGRIIEAREYLGMMLYIDGQYARALDNYEAALEMTPNRYHLYYGAAISAREDGQTELAAEYFNDLVELADPNEVDRPEVQEAEEFLGEFRAAGGPENVP